MICPCTRCAAQHPAFYPRYHERTLRKHKAKYGIAPVLFAPRPVSPDANAPEVAGSGNNDHCPVASALSSSDGHNEGDDSDDYKDVPLVGARGRPKRHFRILNRPATELALDVIRKHNFSDAAANDMLTVMSSISPLFSGHLLV